MIKHGAYEYDDSPSSGNLWEEDDSKKHLFVPLEEQLKGVVGESKLSEHYEYVDDSSYNQPAVESDVKPAEEASVKHKQRTGMLDQTMSTSLALTIAGLMLIYTTWVNMIFALNDRINMLITIGVVFLVASLISLIGSNIMLRVKKELDFFRAINGLTVGAGIGFVLSILMFFLNVLVVSPI